MGRECDHGFAELFRAANGRVWTDRERRELDAMSQPERNRWVKEQAARTDGAFATGERIGTDGRVYTAFWRAG